MVRQARQSGTSETRLTEAFTELQRLSNDDLFETLEHLWDVEHVSGTADLSVESVRMLRRWSAEYLRVAAELEAAARCCRLIEQELREQVDEFLASLPGSAKRHRGLPGWLKTLAQHGHPAHARGPGPDERGPGPDERGPGPDERGLGPDEPGAEAVSPVTPSDPGPEGPEGPEGPDGPDGPDRPEADVAALMLGPLELDVAGRRVARWSSLKARAIFQYLLIHRDRPVRRDVLMELQWPSHTYTSARNNLNVALYSLRNTLDGPWHGRQPILYRDGCYALNPGLSWWVDRDEFLGVLKAADLVRDCGRPRQAICHYQKAIQLYRGPLFEDDLTGDWYLPEQRHLNELYLQALERLGEIYFDLGEVASAKFYGQLALSSDSCCEPVHRLLMRCHATENKQQLVTRQYRLCADALHDELGVSPGAETLRLFRELTSATPPAS